MITIFTSAKPFFGKTKVRQMNALRSWKALSPDIEIILLGSGEGYAEAARELGIIHIPDVETTEQGTPLINSMFAQAQTRGRYPIRMYANCDVVFLDDLLAAVKRLDGLQRFLMVGQRWDVDFETLIDFADMGWRDHVRSEVRVRGALHPIGGSDFFAYKGNIWEGIPNLVVGRARYDHYLIYHCRVARVPVVDATDVVMAIHQNHDYSHHPQGHDGVWYGDEAQLNPAPPKILGGIAFAFGAVDADWRLSRRGMARNFSRGDWERYLGSLCAIHQGDHFESLYAVGLNVARIIARARARITKQERNRGL